MDPVDLLDIVDRLDVWGLALLTVWGFWKIIRLLDSIEKRMVVAETHMAMVETKISEYRKEDRQEHLALRNKVDIIAERTTPMWSDINVK